MVTRLARYVKLTRPSHWVKNALMLPGFALGAQYCDPACSGAAAALAVVQGFFVLSLASAANYVVNGILDAPHDARHPEKQDRPCVVGAVSGPAAAALAGLLAAAAWMLAWLWGGWTLAWLLFAFSIVGGVLYNVPPFRFKEVPYLDVIAESANNPLRFLVGWFLLPQAAWPAPEWLLAYWAFGGFLMSGKRSAELRYFGDPRLASSYRKSYRHYTAARLSVMMAVFGAATVLAKLEWLGTERWREGTLVLLLLLTLMGWFVVLTLRHPSFPREPERIAAVPQFLAFAVLVAAAITVVLGRGGPAHVAGLLSGMSVRMSF